MGRAHRGEIAGAEAGKRHYFIIQPEERRREQGPFSDRGGVWPSATFDFLYKWGMLLTVVALVAVLAASDSFLDPNNIINILRSIAIVTVIAVGVSISLTVGGFDLSVGSTASLANALVISLFVWHGFGTTESIVITLALCTLVGLFNAFLIVILRIPDMLATLASLFVIRAWR